MKLTPEELAALPERVRDALVNGPVTLEEAVKEWEPEDNDWWVSAGGGVFRGDSNLDWILQGNTRATEQQGRRLSKDRQGYCRLHAYRAQYAPDYVEPPIGKVFYYVVINHNGQPRVFDTPWRPLNTITMPKWLCEQLVADIKSGRYKL